MVTRVAEFEASFSDEVRHKAIVFEDVAIAFDERKVLDGISFEVARGETKILLGVAGSGKSTALKLTLGLLCPDRGDIWVLGFEVSKMKERELFHVRRKIGMVFQESALFDSLSVKENVAYRLREDHELAEEEIDRRVREALRFVELEHTVDMFPSSLSGGMRRRVAIARAIVTDPEIVLYDSPTGGLDPITSTNIIELILKQRDVHKTTALLVTHRLPDAYLLATYRFDRETNRMVPLEAGERHESKTSFLILRDGKIIFDGGAAELVGARNEYIKEFIS